MKCAPKGVVLDTNVLISALISPNGNAAQALNLSLENEWSLHTSRFLIEEFLRVARRKKFSEQTITKLLSQLQPVAIVWDPRDVPRVVLNDADDDHIIACAVASNADFIITGDEHLLEMKNHKGIKIVSPKDFSELFEK